MARRIFFGDVHGQYDGLMHLLEAIAPAGDDALYFVGDLIDRGAKSAQVVDYVRDHASGCVLGNHEQLLLDAFSNDGNNGVALHAWLYSGGQATLASYDGNVERLTDHVQWMRQLPLYIDLQDVWLVHAGVAPDLAIAEQSAEEFCWIRDSFHSSPKPYFDNKLIITGHTITFTFPDVAPGQIVSGPGWLDIDTGAYHPRSGWLTAVDIDSEQVYQVNVHERKRRTRSLEAASMPFTQGRQRISTPRP